MVVQQNLRILIVSLIMYNDFIDTLIETANSLQMILMSTIDESLLTIYIHFKAFQSYSRSWKFIELLNCLLKKCVEPETEKANKQTNKQTKNMSEFEN